MKIAEKMFRDFLEEHNAMAAFEYELENGNRNVWKQNTIHELFEKNDAHYYTRMCDWPFVWSSTRDSELWKKLDEKWEAVLNNYKGDRLEECEIDNLFKL